MPIMEANLMELEEGEAWDDPLTLILTREQVSVALICAMRVMGDTTKGIDKMKALADNGDLLAAVAGLALTDTAKTIQSLLRDLTKYVSPALYAEWNAELEKRERKAARKSKKSAE